MGWWTKCGYRPPKKPKTNAEDYGIEIPPVANVAAVLRFGAAALELAGELEADTEFQRLQERLERAEARNSKLEGDLLDRGDKLPYCRDQRIPELLEENRCLQARIDSLAATDIQIKNCEVQLAEGQEKAGKVAEAKRQLAKALEEEARVHRDTEALRVSMEQLKSERDATEARLDRVATLGFELCKGLLAVIDPNLPLDLIIPENDVFEGKLVKQVAGRPLDEAEILFVAHADEEPK